MGSRIIAEFSVYRHDLGDLLFEGKPVDSTTFLYDAKADKRREERVTRSFRVVTGVDRARQEITETAARQGWDVDWDKMRFDDMVIYVDFVKTVPDED
jgi:hypothetical protein